MPSLKADATYVYKHTPVCVLPACSDHFTSEWNVDDTHMEQSALFQLLHWSL